MKKTKIGFIGLGMMGKYMAKNLIKNNYQVTGYNRSKKVLAELKKTGLVVSDSPKQVAEKCDVVILMLPTHKETNDVVFGKNGLNQGLTKGQIVIDMSTSNPAETTKIMKRLKKKGVIMMDAPVSRGQKAAVNGTLSIMTGGEKKAFQKCLPIFKSMGTFVVHLGPFGSGMYVKAFNNFLFAMNLLASTQGLLIMKKNKIDFKKAIEVISESSGENQGLSFDIKNNLGKKHPTIGFYLKYMTKDVGIFDQVVKDQKISHSVAKPVLDFYKKMSKDYGDEDTMYLFEHLALKGEK